MVDGLNFKDFVAFLSAFSANATTQQKIECKCWLLNNLTGLVLLLIQFQKKSWMNYKDCCNCMIITYLGSNAYVYLNALHMLFLLVCNLFFEIEI
jgi:hypothetical protein